MKLLFFFLSLITLFFESAAQEEAINRFVNDTSMSHASVSVCIIDPLSGIPAKEFDAQRSLVPASTLKLVTTAAAIELMGSDFTFKTSVGYRGTFDTPTKTLKGDIIIKGGGDPCLGSEYFYDYYGDIILKWSEAIAKAGIIKVDGRVITDDSFYNYEPLPSKWLWEDIGNYYGAGTFGLSIFDNTYSVHLNTSKPGDKPEITSITPEFVNPEITNFLISGGNRDEGYIYSSPYNNNSWISGTVPQNRTDFVLKGSITDPPLLAAKLLNAKLKSSGISVSGEPSTTRILDDHDEYSFNLITETISPPLSEIIYVLNHESINLYAESLTKHIGLLYKHNGSTESGIEVILEFLKSYGVETDGINMVDGSGLSPVNSISSRELARLLYLMKTKSKQFECFRKSLPEAGKTGTLQNYFTDQFFNNRLRLKTGSMSGVRSFAGYVTANSGKEMIVTIIVNNYSGSSERVISAIEEVIRGVIKEN
jgi:serine-type D-Ala-D-Ala carboxypeptidase/endopeptidase (penicillin-binding protein 4)